MTAGNNSSVAFLPALDTDQDDEIFPRLRASTSFITPPRDRLEVESTGRGSERERRGGESAGAEPVRAQSMRPGKPPPPIPAGRGSGGGAGWKWDEERGSCVHCGGKIPSGARRGGGGGGGGEWDEAVHDELENMRVQLRNKDAQLQQVR